MGKVVIQVDSDYYRPTEVDILVGDATKAKAKLKWIPSYSFKEIVAEMVFSDLNTFKKTSFKDIQNV